MSSSTCLTDPAAVTEIDGCHPAWRSGHRRRTDRQSEPVTHTGTGAAVAWVERPNGLAAVRIP
jgi:hypothetical protein